MPITPKQLGSVVEELVGQVDSLTRENIALRILLRDCGLTEEQIQKHVVEHLDGLPSSDEMGRLLKKTCEAVLATMADLDLEEALRKFPGTGKPQ